MGEWLLQTEEFRSWHDCCDEGEGDMGVLLFYGGPGVNKTFIRYDNENYFRGREEREGVLTARI